MSANAQEYLDTKITSKEKAVFAFFRSAGVAPDYEYWIKSSRIYQALSEKKQEEYLIKEMLRLGRGYGLYDLNTDVLELKVPIIVKYHPVEEEGEKPCLTFRFFQISDKKIPIFDFSFGEDVISLIINQLEIFSDLKLSQEQDEAVRSKIPYEYDEFDAELEIHAQVYKADYKHPIRQEGAPTRWLMMGRIAYLKCVVDSMYMQQTHILWDYLSPSYEEQFRIKNMPEEEKYPHPYDLFK
ncbi:MAG: hypothetical protein KAJ40_06200 [Alphaproteobacteria bacterium]|nr:hypothetical protein [Alphaproteobacteria bacterium]